MQLGPGEPAAGPWQTLTFADFVRRLLAEADVPRPVIAVDGRGAGGKSTLAGRLAAAIPGAVMVSTDDIAWNYSMFGWDELAADGVLRPFRDGHRVDYRPPGWDGIDRPGSIAVPAEATALVFEGVGASRVALAPLLDLAVWVQSDIVVAEQRGLARDIASGVNGNEAETIAFWHTWMAEELPFFAADRPWERADVIVAGTSEEPVDVSLVRFVPGRRAADAPPSSH